MLLPVLKSPYWRLPKQTKMSCSSPKNKEIKLDFFYLFKANGEVFVGYFIETVLDLQCGLGA